MSINVEEDNTSHKLDTEQLLLQILRQLRLQNEILKEMTGIEMTIGDLDE